MFYDNPMNLDAQHRFRKSDGSGDYYDEVTNDFILSESEARVKLSLEPRCKICSSCELCKLSRSLESKTGSDARNKIYDNLTYDENLRAWVYEMCDFPYKVADVCVHPV